MIYLNESFEMKKIELHFLTDNSKEIVIANYNSEYEFIDLKYDNPEMRKIKERIKIEYEQQELQKLERQKQMEEAILFTRIEKNKKVINAIQSKLKFLNDEKDFEFICNNFLLKGVKYDDWSINANKNFKYLNQQKNSQLILIFLIQEFSPIIQVFLSKTAKYHLIQI